MRLKAVKLRLCDKDRETFGGPEWVRFDPAALDDIPWQTQYEWETGDLGLAIEWILTVDWPTKSARGKVAILWLARTIANIPTPPLDKFAINVGPNGLQIADDKAEGGDADPPSDAGLPSSTEGRPKKASR